MGGKRADCRATNAAAMEELHNTIVELRRPIPLKARGGRLRTVVVVGPDGAPVKRATHADVVQGLVRALGIASVADGKRPLVVQCVDCGTPVPVRPIGKIPLRCAEHRREASRRGLEARRAKDPDAIKAGQRESMRRQRERDPEHAKAVARRAAKTRREKPGWREEHARRERERLQRRRAEREAAENI
jgi:hypothetical protein